MFALGIVDKLTPGSLTGGKYIAGTGTIDDQGTVGADRRHPQKMIGARRNGATVFLPPPELRRGRADRARRAAAGQGRTTLDDAVTALDDLRAGRERCRPAALLERRSQSAKVAGQRVGQARHQVAPGEDRGLVVVRAHPQRRTSATRRAAPPRPVAPPDAPGARRASAAPRPRPAACPARRRAAPSAARRPAPRRAPRRGQTMPAEQLVEAADARLGQVALVDRRAGRPGRPSPRPSSAASCGSRRSRSAVSTRANRRGGWSQPSAAACRSRSSVSASSRGLPGRRRRCRSWVDPPLGAVGERELPPAR